MSNTLEERLIETLTKIRALNNKANHDLLINGLPKAIKFIQRDNAPQTDLNNIVKIEILDLRLQKPIL